jgi:hypothetical protein
MDFRPGIFSDLPVYFNKRFRPLGGPAACTAVESWGLLPDNRNSVIGAYSFRNVNFCGAVVDF